MAFAAAVLAAAAPSVAAPELDPAAAAAATAFAVHTGTGDEGAAIDPDG